MPKRAKLKAEARIEEWLNEMARLAKKEDETTPAKFVRLLELALAYESHVVWVDLTWWHHLLRRDEWRSWGYGDWRPTRGNALVDVYFGEFAPELAKAGIKSGLPPLTRAHFAERAASIVDWTCSPESDDWKHQPPDAICCLEESPNIYRKPPPYFACVGRPRIRLEPWSPAVCEPYLAQFEALAQRVANRDRWRQRELGGEN